MDCFAEGVGCLAFRGEGLRGEVLVLGGHLLVPLKRSEQSLQLGCLHLMWTELLKENRAQSGYISCLHLSVLHDDKAIKIPCNFPVRLVLDIQSQQSF